MGRYYVLPLSGAKEKNKKYCCIKKKIIVQKCLEDKDINHPIKICLDIIQHITTYIGNIKGWFEIDTSNYLARDRLK